MNIGHKYTQHRAFRLVLLFGITAGENAGDVLQDVGRAFIVVAVVLDQTRFHDVDLFLCVGVDDVADQAGELDRDVVCVVRFQGPRANGMPELHGLTPSLSVLQDRGYKVALVTDGRMSGASGKIPAAIHLSPEADGGGPIARLRDGDIVRIDANEGNLSVIDVDLDSRDVADAPTTEFAGVGRELFEVFRGQVGSATTGASIFS